VRAKAVIGRGVTRINADLTALNSRLSALLRVLMLFVGSLLAACTMPMANTPTPIVTSITVPTTGLTLPAGYRATVVVAGLLGPTQMILGPDGRLWVAQLAGNENDGQGQVIAIDLTSGEQTVLLDNLMKPVGIAVLDNALWIAARNNLLRAPLEGQGAVGAPEIVLADLPFNGRSIGTLTVTPAGHLLYETSGVRQGNAAAPGSATLWALDPADPTQPRPLATGLKGAYAHAFDRANRLWTTEIGDDLVNGAAPPDELNLVIEGADFGWPQCFGVQEPAQNYGGTAEICQATRAAVAVFPPRSTPTSVVASPWEEDVLLVALWVQGMVMRVPITLQGDNATGTPEPFITGLQNPQHLLVLEDGALLVSDFSGTIYRVERE